MQEGFVKLENVFQGEVSREEGNEMSEGNHQIEPQTPTPKLRSLRTPRLTQRYSLSLYYLLLTDESGLECYDETLEVGEKTKCEHAMNKEMEYLI